MSYRIATFLSIALLAVVMAYGISRKAPSPFCSQGDTISYRLVDFSNTPAVLGHIRTPVYPALLKVADSLGVPDAWRPLLQGLVFALLVIVFWFGCSISGLSLMQSLAASLPLAWSAAFLDYMDQMLPETLATGLGFATLGLILGRRSSQHWYLREALLGTLMALAVLTKPQYLVLVPVSLGTLFLLWRAGHFQPMKSHRRQLLAAVGVTCGPLLAYSFLRLLIVGHFGIVSFGGANIAGFALNPMMFDKAVVETLPAGELRDAGQAILAQREKLLEAIRNGKPLTTITYLECPADTIDIKALRGKKFSDAWWEAYNPAIHSVARPAVSQWLGYGLLSLYGQANVKTDRILSKLSVHALKARPLLYLKWLRFSCHRSLEQGLRLERWSNRLMSGMLGVGFVGVWILGFWMMGRILPLRPFLWWAAILGIFIGCACFSERLIGIALGLWGWIPGFVAPVLFPASVFLAGIILACARVIRGTSLGRIGATEFLMICFSLWAAAAGLLFCAIEVPLDRYLMTVRPLIAAQCFVVLVWVAIQAANKIRSSWAHIKHLHPRAVQESRSN